MNDHLLRVAIAIYGAPRALGARLNRSERGQTGAEYLGILILVAAIIVYVVTETDLDETIGDAMEDAVEAITDETP